MLLTLTACRAPISPDSPSYFADATCIAKMLPVDRDLSRALHSLTIRLDRAADRILQAEVGLPYRRYLVLYAVHELGRPSQRALARWLDVTEPSVSRMVRSLVDAGWLAVGPAPAGGNRRAVELTPAGAELVGRCGRLLEGRLATVVEGSGVGYDGYRDATLRLAAALAAGDRTAGR